ncbi:MAG TPA: glycosyltransferase [Phycisphaerae bacterium]|nr:glycosyltransferase [Phycisphaerae bacterium]
MSRFPHRPETREARKGVSIVVPVFNEEACIDELIRRCIAAGRQLSEDFELILVDDGSSDSSAERISEAAEQHAGFVVGVLLNRNYGQHSAVMAGFAQARGEIIVTLDADLQNPPEEIPRLVRCVEEGADVVGTIRVPRHDSPLRKVSSWIVNKVVRRATGVMMHDYGCMLRAYRRSVVDAMLSCTERSTFIPVLANSFAYRTAEIEVQHGSRPQGTSKYSLWKLINLQFDLLTSMTTFPLRMLSVLGVLAATAGIGFGILLMVMRMWFGAKWAAEGVFTLFAAMFTLIGAQFIALGLLGEYVGRIYQDVRSRPRYCVRTLVGKGLAGPRKQNEHSELVA